MTEVYLSAAPIPAAIFEPPGWGPVRPVPFPDLAAAQQLISQAVLLCGWSVRNTNTTAGSLALYGGATAEGPLLASDAVASGGSDQSSLPWPGVLCDQGIWAVPTAGTYALVLFVRYLTSG